MHTIHTPPMVRVVVVVVIVLVMVKGTVCVAHWCPYSAGDLSWWERVTKDGRDSR